MNANEAYLLARAYTNKALEGAGALKGAPCQIKSITQITGGHRVTFEWEDSEGETSTETMDVMDGTNGTDGDDGADGNGIVSITKTGTSGLVDTYTITYTDGMTSTFTVTNGQDGGSNEFIGTLAEWNALTTEQKKAYDTYQITNDYSEALMPNYSTVEQKTGQKWIDGKDIYSKTFTFDTTAAQQTAIDVSSCNIETNIAERINCGPVTNTYYFDNSDFLRTYLKTNNTILTIERGSASVKGAGSITLYYTKTA